MRELSYARMAKVLDDPEMKAVLELARDVTRETLHGAPPIRTTMSLAAALLRIQEAWDK